jgi:hypothetical protein
MAAAYTPLKAFLNSFLDAALRGGPSSPKWTPAASCQEHP